MEKCPFCNKDMNLKSLSFPYITWSKKAINLPKICQECKNALDEHGAISDPTDSFGYLIPRQFRR